MTGPVIYTGPVACHDLPGTACLGNNQDARQAHVTLA